MDVREAEGLLGALARWGVVLCVCGAWGWGCADDAQPPSQPTVAVSSPPETVAEDVVSVYGRVVRLEDGAPIAGARVTLVPQGTALLTNADGAYVFAGGLEVGSVVTLEASASGRAPTSLTVEVLPAKQLAVDITLGPDVEGGLETSPASVLFSADRYSAVALVHNTASGARAWSPLPNLDVTASTDGCPGDAWLRWAAADSAPLTAGASAELRLEVCPEGLAARLDAARDGGSLPRAFTLTTTLYLPADAPEVALPVTLVPATQPELTLMVSDGASDDVQAVAPDTTLTVALDGRASRGGARPLQDAEVRVAFSASPTAAPQATRRLKLDAAGRGEARFEVPATYSAPTLTVTASLIAHPGVSASKTLTVEGQAPAQRLGACALDDALDPLPLLTPRRLRLSCQDPSGEPLRSHPLTLGSEAGALDVALADPDAQPITDQDGALALDLTCRAGGAAALEVRSGDDTATVAVLCGALDARLDVAGDLAWAGADFGARVAWAVQSPCPAPCVGFGVALDQVTALDGGGTLRLEPEALVSAPDGGVVEGRAWATEPGRYEVVWSVFWEDIHGERTTLGVESLIAQVSMTEATFVPPEDLSDAALTVADAPTLSAELTVTREEGGDAPALPLRLRVWREGLPDELTLPMARRATAPDVYRFETTPQEQSERFAPGVYSLQAELEVGGLRVPVGGLGRWVVRGAPTLALDNTSRTTVRGCARDIRARVSWDGDGVSDVLEADVALEHRALDAGGQPLGPFMPATLGPRAQSEEADDAATFGRWTLRAGSTHTLRGEWDTLRDLGPGVHAVEVRAVARYRGGEIGLSGAETWRVEVRDLPQLTWDHTIDPDKVDSVMRHAGVADFEGQGGRFAVGVEVEPGPDGRTLLSWPRRGLSSAYRLTTGVNVGVGAEVTSMRIADVYDSDASPDGSPEVLLGGLTPDGATALWVYQWDFFADEFVLIGAFDAALDAPSADAAAPVQVVVGGPTSEGGLFSRDVWLVRDGVVARRLRKTNPNNTVLEVAATYTSASQGYMWRAGALRSGGEPLAFTLEPIPDAPGTSRWVGARAGEDNTIVYTVSAPLEGDEPGPAAMADLNGDGLTDLVYATRTATPTLHIATRDPSVPETSAPFDATTATRVAFAPKLTRPLAEAARDVALYDLDDDGRSDALILYDSGRVEVWFALDPMRPLVPLDALYDAPLCEGLAADRFASLQALELDSGDALGSVSAGLGDLIVLCDDPAPRSWRLLRMRDVPELCGGPRWTAGGASPTTRAIEGGALARVGPGGQAQAWHIAREGAARWLVGVGVHTALGLNRTERRAVELPRGGALDRVWHIPVEGGASRLAVWQPPELYAIDPEAPDGSAEPLALGACFPKEVAHDPTAPAPETLLVSCAEGEALRLAPGDGARPLPTDAFRAAMPSPQAYITAAQTAALDGDAALDLVLAVYDPDSGSSALLTALARPGAPPRVSQQVALGPGVAGMWTMDINRDGIPDVITADKDAYTLRFWRSGGAGELDAMQVLTLRPAALSAPPPAALPRWADVYQDAAGIWVAALGASDDGEPLVEAWRLSPSALGSPQHLGVFRPYDPALGSTPTHGLSIAPNPQGGAPALVLFGSPTQVVALPWAGAPWPVEPLADVPGTIVFAEALDADRDGTPELATFDDDARTLSVWAYDANAQQWRQETPFDALQPHRVMAIDAAGGPEHELLVCSGGGFTLSGGAFSAPFPYVGRDCGAADIDGDGLAEVFALDSGDLVRLDFASDAAFPAVHRFDSAASIGPGQPQRLKLGYVDDDARLDLVYPRNSTTTGVFFGDTEAAMFDQAPALKDWTSEPLRPRVLEPIDVGARQRDVWLALRPAALGWVAQVYDSPNPDDPFSAPRSEALLVQAHHSSDGTPPRVHVARPRYGRGRYIVVALPWGDADTARLGGLAVVLRYTPHTETLEEVGRWAVGDGLLSADAADWDHDGWLDLAATHGARGRIQLYTGQPR